MKKKLKIIANAMLVLIVLGLVLYFSLKDNYLEIISLIKSISLGWIILAIIFVCLYRFLSGSSLYYLVKNSKKKISIMKAFQISFIIMFFHAVTPFNTGGQPMEVYYLHKENVPIEKGTNIVLQNFILYQTALILIGLITILYNNVFKIFPFNSIMRKLVILGFLINFGVWLITVMLAFGKKSSTNILVKLIKFLHKLHIIKDRDKVIANMYDYANKFYESAGSLRKNKLLLVKILGINIIALIINYSIPYILACGLGINNLTIMQTIVATSYVMIIGSFVPIPGGTGGIEYGFMYFFGCLLSGSVLPALMLIWRFITYYIGMIIGAIVLVFYRKRSSYGKEKAST